MLRGDYRPPVTTTPRATASTGFPEALAAYLIWGFLPLYLILVEVVPPTELVAWRIIWTLPLCLAIVIMRKQLRELGSALRDRRAMFVLAASAALIAVNWLVYVWAIQNGHVLAASLGYYINPLVNVLLGTLILGERLKTRQWIAIAIAALGVAILLAGALATLWISLVLAFSFGTYGLLRKQVSVGSLPGLTIEAALLLIPAAATAWWFARTPAGSSFGTDWSLSLLIVFGGVVTAVPLLLFAMAARKMDSSTLGMIQFLAPTIVFLLGLFVFGEPLKPVQLASFVLIWTAIAIFVQHLLTQRRSET